MSSEVLRESETVELKKGLAEMKEGLISMGNSPENALDKLELRKNGQLLSAARLFFADQPIQLRCASFARPSFNFNDQETTEETVDKPRLSAREIALCSLVTRQPQITQKELAEQLGLTERGIRYLTDKLQKQGVLVRQGGKKQGTWVLLVEVRDE